MIVILRFKKSTLLFRIIIKKQNMTTSHDVPFLSRRIFVSENILFLLVDWLLSRKIFSCDDCTSNLTMISLNFNHTASGAISWHFAGNGSEKQTKSRHNNAHSARKYRGSSVST